MVVVHVVAVGLPTIHHLPAHTRHIRTKQKHRTSLEARLVESPKRVHVPLVRSLIPHLPVAPKQRRVEHWHERRYQVNRLHTTRPWLFCCCSDAWIQAKHDRKQVIAHLSETLVRDVNEGSAHHYVVLAERVAWAQSPDNVRQVCERLGVGICATEPVQSLWPAGAALALCAN